MGIRIAAGFFTFQGTGRFPWGRECLRFSESRFVYRKTFPVLLLMWAPLLHNVFIPQDGNFYMEGDKWQQ